MLYPIVCAGCRRPGALLCADCRAQLYWIEALTCGWCAQPLRDPTPFCPACAGRERPLGAMRAAVWHDGPIPAAIHQLKYQHRHGLSAMLAELMALRWPQWEWTADCLVPVPLHPDRERERGYNQAQLLAAELAAALGIALEVNGLFRTRYTRPQVGLHARERKVNVTAAFQAAHEHVRGRRILLIDDVCTTGSTLTAAALALRQAGALSVDAYCLARAQPDAHHRSNASSTAPA